MDPVALARALVDIDSTTGREGDACRWLAAFLREQRFDVVEQPVDGPRFNIIATPTEGLTQSSRSPQRSPSSQSPTDGLARSSQSTQREDASLRAPRSPRADVVLSTHVDCVPPFFPSRVEGDRLYGRGSCDAKGIIAAQVAAVDRLRREGETRVGLLFVVGEERGSDGARRANEAANGSRFLIDGEPTDNRLGLATRGILRLKLHATGRAAHSSYPELGESAIDKLIDALTDLRSIELPADPELGRTHYTIGLIAGGVAPNVIPPSAAAEVMFRIVSDAAEVRRVVSSLEPRVSIEHVLEVPPVRLTTVPGFETAVFPFTTDIPFLPAWGEPLLFGPGSVHAAHTADEFIEIADLRAAADHYAAISRALLNLMS